MRLLPSAVVDSESVMLSDVADVRGDSAQLAARMQLGAAPHIGKTGVVELSQLQSMLARRGVNLSNWVFRGASRCTVQRVGRAAPPQPGTDASSNRSTALEAGRSPGGTPVPHRVIQDHQDELTTQPAEGTEASRAAVCDPQSLEGLLRRHLAGRVSELGGTPEIRFSPAAARVLSLARPTYDFRITDRADRLLGMVPLEVAVIEGGLIRQTLPVIADVSLRKTVIVASRPINRGEILKSTHLVSEERLFDRIDQIGLDDTAMLIGQQAKRFIDARSVLSMRDVEPMPLIHTNDLVTVLVRRGALTIRGSAKALSTGGLGDTVQLKNEMSKQVFTAVVTGQKTAEVRDSIHSPRSIDRSAPLTAVAQHSVRIGEGGQ